MYVQVMFLWTGGFISSYLNVHFFLEIDGVTFLCKDILELLLIIVTCMTSFLLQHRSPFIL